MFHPRGQGVKVSIRVQLSEVFLNLVKIDMVQLSIFSTFLTGLKTTVGIRYKVQEEARYEVQEGILYKVQSPFFRQIFSEGAF